MKATLKIWVLRAIKRALALGADLVEVDRTTNGRGYVKDMILVN